jgi:FAD dependent oxidoreductase TIGR03364
MEDKDLDIFTGFPVIDCSVSHSEVVVTRSDGQVFKADHVIICNGSDFQVLFPERFKNSRLILSKLQMMQTVPQPKDYCLPGSILTGWSIRRYEAFSECPSYAEIKEKENKNSPQHMWGVHILFKQAADGSVILGDSHQYAPAANSELLGYDLDMNIDRFMQEEASKIIDLPNQKIRYRWFGVYSQTPEGDVYQESIDDKIHIITGIGGKGMTASAGFAEESINSIFHF